MNEKELIAAMRDALIRDGWRKGSTGGMGIPMCLTGAFLEVKRGLTYNLDSESYGYSYGYWWKDHWWKKTEESIARAVTELFPGRAWFSVGWSAVIQFNDHPDTTWEDILLVLKHAEGT